MGTGESRRGHFLTTNALLAFRREVRVAIFRADPRTGLTADTVFRVGDRHDLLFVFLVIIVVVDIG